MTSKEALDILNYECIHCNGTDDEFSKELNLIKKDLEILDCFRKIPKRDLKEFIENEITFEENYNTWLVSCNCNLGKEEQTKHLIKIKEWLEYGETSNEQ